MTQETQKKSLLLEELKNRIKHELEQAKSAFDTTRKHATDAELKADGKYDTRSIEAGYLAGAQKKRVDELELELGLLDEVSLTHASDKVSVGSMVSLEHNGQERVYFISSTSGGSMIKVLGEVVLVISAFSPIGSEVIGLEVGDSFEVEVKEGSEPREYQVKKIN